MADNIVLMPASRRTTLAPQAAQACAQLLAQTIEFLDKQIERAEELLGADRAHLFLRAIDAHVADKLDASVQSQGNQSLAYLRRRHCVWSAPRVAGTAPGCLIF
jgi:hypothetical protein